MGAESGGGPQGPPGGGAESTKELAIYDTIEVLPEPRREPESENESEDESEESEKSEESEESEESEDESGDKSGGNEIDIYGDDDETIPQDATVEPHPSPKPQQPDIAPRTQHNRKLPPPPFDPSSYVST